MQAGYGYPAPPPCPFFVYPILHNWPALPQPTGELLAPHTPERSNGMPRWTESLAGIRPCLRCPTVAPVSNQKRQDGIGYPTDATHA
jgi:hypothetical protein